jgi:hypothetical protein
MAPAGRVEALFKGRQFDDEIRRHTALLTNFVPQPAEGVLRMPLFQPGDEAQ